MSAYKRDVISLKSYAPAQSLPAFLGIRCYGEPSHEFLTLLTPNVMQWDDDLWLFDLSLCLRFWQAQAAKLGKHPLSLCEELLAASGQSYKAVFAPHPWQALFLLISREQQAAAPSQGLPVHQELTSLSGPFGQALFSAADWQAWFEALKPLARHFAALKRPRFVLSRFQSQCSQMQRLMERLGSQGPEALKAASQEAIKRRFGTILAEVWQWTFAPTPPPLTSPRPSLPLPSLWGQEDGLAHDTGLPAGFAAFPWRAWQPPQGISVQRHLEAPLSHWQECADYLQEDLERLCQNESWNVAAERITSLEWELTFYHLKTLKVAINFRHPHSLQIERGQQQTALTQAEFAFEAARQELAGRSEDLDLPADIPLIGWRLTLAGRMTMPSWLAPLFAALGEEEEEGAEPSERLLALENKLPLPLDRYYLCPNFDPLAAYSLDPAATAPLAAANLGLWKVAARRRPLFIYDQPHLLPTQAYSSRRQFLERTPCPWWQSPLARQQLARDYYLLIDHSHKAHWVFYDKRGHWYKHGIFS